MPKAAAVKEEQFDHEGVHGGRHRRRVCDTLSVGAADEFRHVVIGLEMSAAELRGEKFDYGARIKADEEKPKTRDSVVKEMEAAIAVSYPLVQSGPKPRLVWWLEHQPRTMANSYRTIG